VSTSPTISIITPSFNQAAFLEETMLSVFRQDHSEIEYIVVDGGSTDGSQEIIKRHERKLAYWISERDYGQADAIMKGFSRAKGEILAWLNSDDTLAPSAARIAAEYLGSDPSLGLVYGDRLHIDKKGNVIGINQGPSFYGTMLQHNITLPQETVFFRRALYDQAGGLDKELHFATDIDLWIRLQKITKFKHVPAFFGSFRAHPRSKSLVLCDEQDQASSTYKREQEIVFRRHFGRSLPGRRAMRWYRLQHKSRFLLESMSRPYREEREKLRKFMELVRGSC
jgi:glycosyltransferase involved in cell wall biosynthesis